MSPSAPSDWTRATTTSSSGSRSPSGSRASRSRPSPSSRASGWSWSAAPARPRDRALEVADERGMRLRGDPATEDPLDPGSVALEQRPRVEPEARKDTRANDPARVRLELDPVALLEGEPEDGRVVDDVHEILANRVTQVEVLLLVEVVGGTRRRDLDDELGAAGEIAVLVHAGRAAPLGEDPEELVGLWLGDLVEAERGVGVAPRARSRVRVEREPHAEERVGIRVLELDG